MIRLFNITFKKSIEVLNTTPFFIEWGQSNCGRSRYSEMTTEQQNMYGGLINNVLLYNRGNKLEVMNVGVNTYLRNPVFSDECGKEGSFCKLMQNYYQKNIVYYKYGYGNTFLADNINTLDWDVSKSTELYKWFIDDLKSLCEQAKINGLYLDLKAVNKMQGENDATIEADANNYNSNVTSWFNQFRNDWSNLSNLYFPDVTIDYWEVLDRINPGSDSTQIYADTVQFADVQYCNVQFPSNPDSDNAFINRDLKRILINNGDSTTDGIRTFKDGIHYDVSSQIQRGIDHYNALINVI